MKIQKKQTPDENQRFLRPAQISLIILTLIFMMLLTTNAAVKVNPASLVEDTDLAVSITDTPDPAMRGENVTYVITVTNTTTVEAQSFKLRAFASTASTFVSLTEPAGFNCTTPAVGDAGQIDCSAPTVGGSSTNVFTMVVKVDSGAGIGASLYTPVNIAATNDFNGGNNAAAETTGLTGGIFVNDADGNYQKTNVNTPFPKNFKVQVTDGNYSPLSGVQVTFTAPSFGASGTFAGGMTTVTITTDQDGYATAPIFTANGTAGDYVVTATAPDANSSVSFNLSNVAPMTFTVGNLNDTGAGSLRQAIEDANNNTGDDTVVFDPAIFSTPQTITLTSGEISIDNNGSLTINGPGADKLTISGNNASRIFTVSGAFTLNNLKMTNGTANNENGGAIFSYGAMQINQCAFYNNTASNGGGAIASVANALTVNQSTFFGNQSPGGLGGAILIYAIEGSSATGIINSTFNQNTAKQGGAIYKGSAIFGGDPLRLDLTSVTIAGNTANMTGGGVLIENGNFNVINSIIAGNSSDDINGMINSRGYNLIQSTNNTVFSGGTPQTDLTNVNPMLAPLSKNGGTTETMALLAGSPAIDQGTSANIQNLNVSGGQKAKNSQSDGNTPANLISAATDQRGAVRPVDLASIPNAGDGSDIGAFEMAEPTAAGASISGRVLAANGRGINNAVVILTDQRGRNRSVRTNSFGYFNFREVRTGETYLINVRHKTYQFVSQAISINADLQNLIFTSLN